jgi:hypothetical protein
MFIVVSSEVPEYYYWDKKRNDRRLNAMAYENCERVEVLEADSANGAPEPISPERSCPQFTATGC